MRKLADGVFFVRGAKHGAIYDTNAGNVYSINGADCETLVERLDSQRVHKNDGVQELIRIPSLQFIWFEIVSDDCNERCIHCYADSMPPTYRKKMGLPVIQENTQPSRRKLTAGEWRKLIAEGRQLGCPSCQFIGGEPFVWRGENGEDVLDLAEYAHSQGYESIEIFTNATLLTEAKISRIKELGVSVAVSLYSIQSEIHDAVTRTPGSMKKTLGALDLLRKHGIRTRVETILMRMNESTLEETENWIRKNGFRHRKPDPIRPKGRGDNPLIFPSKENTVKLRYLLKPNFRTDIDTLSRYLSGHSCMAGKITVTDTGDVLPCIFSRNMVTGNVIDIGSLEGVLLGELLQRIWNSTKDSVLVCQDCEYRHVCFDCRPLSQGVAGECSDYFTAPYPRCTYNPYTGEWAGGTWKLDETGKPYYDGDLKPTIEQVLADRKVNQQPTLEEEGECDGE